jgi:hypothetical protein
LRITGENYTPGRENQEIRKVYSKKTTEEAQRKKQ